MGRHKSGEPLFFAVWMRLYEDEIRDGEELGTLPGAASWAAEATGSIVGILRKLDVPRVGRRRHLPFDC
jgi:hypothetical protein